MSNFNFIKTEIEGVIIVEMTAFGDSRGYFMETYEERKFAEGGITAKFVQDNQSKSTKGVLRGLHFQKTHPQAKLVRVIKGEVYDVAVDLRKTVLHTANMSVRFSVQKTKSSSLFLAVSLMDFLFYPMKLSFVINAMTFIILRTRAA